jgi:hypothetical protein
VCLFPHPVPVGLDLKGFCPVPNMLRNPSMLFLQTGHLGLEHLFPSRRGAQPSGIRKNRDLLTESHTSGHNDSKPSRYRYFNNISSGNTDSHKLGPGPYALNTMASIPSLTKGLRPS